MNLFQFLGSLELGLIYSLVAIGVFISFRVLDFPDLTVDGSFPMGAAIAGILIVEGFNPWLATAIAMLGGAMAGTVTAWLNVRWGILNLLAGILTMTALYSVNLRIMGRPNISLLSESTIFTPLMNLFPRNVAVVIMMTIIVGIVLWLLNRFLSSEVGLAMRATGKNKKMARAQGVHTKYMVLSGIALSNSLVALAGALFTQSLGFAEVSMGIGTIVAGLAAVIIGEVIFSTRLVWVAILAGVLGSILYRMVLAFALNSDIFGLQTSDQSLIAAILVALAMISSKARQPLRSILKGKGRRGTV